MSTHKLAMHEKVGYAMGDAAANLVWRGALAYLAIFYTDTLGIAAAAAAALFLIIRISDGITDIIMGMIADRTTSKAGKFRPWIIWSAPVLAGFMVLCFTAPDISPTMKLVWAYFTYIGLTLAYTVNNVPYSALMGVMTDSHQERQVLSGFRFAGAFLGGILVMSFTPDLVDYFGQGDDAAGYQKTFYLFAALLIVLCVITYFTTKERVEAPNVHGPLKSELKELIANLPYIIIPLLAISLFFYYRNIPTGIFFVVTMAASWYFLKKLLSMPEDKSTTSQRDMIDLLTNKPWLMILALGFLTMMFNGIKISAIAYYFEHYINAEAIALPYILDILPPTNLTGKYFFCLLFISIFAALIAGYLAKKIGKKTMFILSLVGSGIFTGLIAYAGPNDVTTVFLLGTISEFFAAFMPVLVFSMLGDTADYSEWKNKRRATGLVYSAGTFIQKTGGGFATALVLVVLGGYGYVGTDPETIKGATEGIRLSMSWIPVIFAALGVVVLFFYPLDAKRMTEIESDLVERRQ